MIKLSQTDPTLEERHPSVPSAYPYEYTSVPLLSDLLKLIVSAILLYRSDKAASPLPLLLSPPSLPPSPPPFLALIPR